MSIRALGGWCALVALGVLLGACGGGGGGGGDASVVVTGTVYGEDGLPRPYVPVGVIGRDLVLTRADGTFTLGGVQRPYSLVLLDPGTPHVTVYQGLTRTNPRVVLYDEYPLHQEEVAGVLTGGVGFPTPAGTQTWVGCGGPYGAFGAGNVNPATGSFTYGSEPRWSGPVVLDATLFAFQYTTGMNGLPLDYTGYGSAPILLRKDVTNLTADFAMTDPGTMSISGSYTPAPGTNFDHADLWMETEPGTSILMVRDTFASGGTFQLRGPIVAGATYALELRTEAVGGVFSIARASGLAPYANGLDLSTSPLHLIIGPPDGTLGVDHDTEFTFAPSPLGVHMLAVTTGFGDGPDPSFYIFTTDTTVRIPDLSMYGLGLPSMEQYSWAVHAWGPWASVDAMAGTGRLWPDVPVAYHTRQAVRSMETAP